MKNVAAAIFLKGDFVLIARRAQNEKLHGYWEFPGGKQEVGETIFECLEREILEEFNVRCKSKDIYCESVYNYNTGTIRLIGILSELLNESIQLNVHDAYQWVDVNELLEYNLSPADITIAKKLIQDYGKRN